MSENIEYKGYTIRIEPDEDTDGPRKDWDTLGTMVCFNRKYNLGDEHSYKYPEEVMRAIEETDAVYLPLYLMDHSSLSMSYADFGCPWDSGQVGVIYVSAERIRKEYGDASPESRVKALKALKSEVEVYDQYLQGDVWGYVITKPKVCPTCCHDEREDVDSLWGMYGYDYCVTEAKAVIDSLEVKEKV